MRSHFTGLRYAEPCAGDGSLIKHMHDMGARCQWASDLVPRHQQVQQRDCFDVTAEDITNCNAVVTNPPFVTQFISEFIDHFLAMDKQVWVIVPVQWTCYAHVAKQMQFCDRFVAVGNVPSFPNMPMQYETYFCWLRFRKESRGISYFGRKNV